MAQDAAEYITDAPISEPPEDRFSRAPFAERIARTIGAQRDPASLVVGVYGPWGDGKTSVLNLIEYTLAGTDDMVPIRFNPWRLGNEAEMFIGFFETLAEALDVELATGKQKVGEALKRYGGLLKPIPFTGGVVGEAASAAGAALSETSLGEARSRIEDLLAQSGKRVVILMDDLDRLDKAEIQAIFRLVKVAADFKHTAYVLAFDASVVEDALAERYATGTKHGMNFMEKIIQLPLHLPPVSERLLRQVTLETVDVALKQVEIELSKTEAGEFVSVFDRAVLPRIKTPRMGKRYGNAVLFALPMIGAEVYPVDLLLVEAMRIFYPRLYEWVRSHEDQVIGRHSVPKHQTQEADNLLREAVVEASAGMEADEKRGAEVLLTTLFPRTQSSWSNMHWPSEWDSTWAKQRRITSRQYFRRFFTYTVPAGDVRDADVLALISLLEDPDHDCGEADDLAHHLIETGSSETFLSKVGQHVEDVSSHAAAHLAVLLAALSDLLPSQSGFLGLSTSERAALMVAKLVERLTPEERPEIVASVVRSSPSIPFAVEVLRRVRPQGGEIKRLTLEETAEAGKLLVERIVPVWEGEDPFAVLGNGVAGTLHTWALYGDAADLRARLASMIADDLSNAFRLMGAFLGQAWSMETGVPLTPEFSREAYNALAEYVDAADLFSLLQDRFGERMGVGEFYGFSELPPEERLANEFAFIHRVVISEDTEGPDALSQD